MDDELAAHAKYLRLTNLLSRWDHYLAVAQKGNCSLVHLLRSILAEEAEAHRMNARAQRLKRALIPEHWVMETFPFAQQPKLDKKRVLTLYDAFEYVPKNENIIWIGPTGCGKTGLATSFLIDAINRGHTGRYVLFPELVGELFSSVADHSEEKVIKRYLAYDCLLIDEMGYVGTGGGPGRPPFHPDATANQEAHDDHHHAARLQTVALVPEEQPSDGGVDRQADRDEPRLQHERLPESEVAAG
jgi:DNA replication protein DnaC